MTECKHTFECIDTIELSRNIIDIYECEECHVQKCYPQIEFLTEPQEEYIRITFPRLLKEKETKNDKG